MIYDVNALPDDAVQLKAIIVSLSQTNVDLLQSNAELHAKLDKMTAELQRITRLFEKFFNKSSEQLPKDKASHDTTAEEEQSPQTPENTAPNDNKGKRKKGGGGRNPLPPDLPRVENVVEHEVPVCDVCGQLFKCIGDECSEQLHFKPMELFVVIQILKKYIADCPCCEKRSETVESPIRADDKGVASNSLIAAVAVQKYMDHLPLARQSKQLFKRCGVTLPESSMSRWMGLAAAICTPLYELMHRLLLEAVFIQMDATGAKYLDPLIKGKAGTGTIWGDNGDDSRPYVLYDFQTHGKRDGPATFLHGYTGYMQCDANTVNHGLFVANTDAPPLVAATEFGCWSHCRRHFYDARILQPASKEVRDMIGTMYGVERRAKKLSHEERRIMRQNESLPMLDNVFAWCRDHRAKYDLPTDLLGKAIQYAINQESYLRVYVNDGRLEIDNNAAERILRLIAIGRKNWLFYGSANGGKTGAVLHSILASAKRNRLNEYEYLLDVINRLADLPKQAEIFNLLPDRWKTKSPR